MPALIRRKPHRRHRHRAARPAGSARVLSVPAIFAFALSLLVAGEPLRAADSAFGCTGLAGDAVMPAIEGRGGIFFRLLPDLAMAPLPDESVVAQLSALSAALAAGGTQLVLVPLPSRALAMARALPVEAEAMGHDAALAATLHDAAIARLSNHGIAAPNVRRALLGGPQDAPAHLATDPRLAPEGERRLARAIAAFLADLPATRALPRQEFVTRMGEASELPSPMRARLQRHCQDPLPPLRVPRVTLKGADAAGENPEKAQVVLVAGEEADNIAAFLAEASGLSTRPIGGDAEGDALEALASYLLSAEFRAARPPVLLWLVPAVDTLAVHGDQPLRELVAAAGPGCRQDLPFEPGGTAGLLKADLRGLDPGRAEMLMVDTGPDSGGSPAMEMRFDFRGPDGTTRSRWVRRGPRLGPTTRFHVPVDGLWPGGAVAVEIRINGVFGPTARVAACPRPVEGTLP